MSSARPRRLGVVARLRERGVELREDGESSCCSACPTARSRRSRECPPGPWVAHVSGATPLSALEPHGAASGCIRCRRSRARGAEQLDGAYAAVTAEAEAVAAGCELAPPGCSRSSSTTRAAPSTTRARRSPRTTWSRSTGRRGAVRGCRCAPRGVVPLMRRTIENGFELTGRSCAATGRPLTLTGGDPRSRSELEPLYRALADLTTRGRP